MHHAKVSKTNFCAIVFHIQHYHIFTVTSLETGSAIEKTKECFEAAGKAVDLYSKVLNVIVPWKEFKLTLADLDKFRDEYSKESVDLIGRIKVFLSNAIDAYQASTQIIYEWTGSTVELLQIYVKLLKNAHSEEHISVKQKSILLEFLDNGNERIKEA